MILKKKYFIFLAVLLVAMMSVAVAADVNDSTESVTTPAVTHTTDNTDVQTATQTSNQIKNTKYVTETVTKEAISGQTRAITPTTHNVNNTTFDTYFKAAGFESNVNAGDTLNFTGNVNRFNSSYKVDKAVIITGNGFTLDLNTTSGSYTGNETGNSFNIINTGSYTNITNITFYNTQIFVKNATHVTFDNVNITVNNQRIGSGVGVLSIRENSTYVTVKNSYIHTCNNSGSSSIVLAQADYCTIDNNTIIGEGNVGNLVYLTTYNIPNVLYTDVNTNTYNNITNNRISTVNLSGGVCVGVVVSGHSNKFEGNNVSVASSFSGQWISPTATLTGDFNDTYEGNSYINNEVYGSFTGTKNSTITGNIFHASVSLPERCIFKNNNAENSTVTVTGPNCDLCNNSMNILKVNNNAVNTRVCWDNDILLINIIDPAGNVVMYVHPFSLNKLNKQNNKLTKTEGEPSIFNITEDNFNTYFINQSETYMFNPSSDGVYNLCYIPPTTQGLYFYYMRNDYDCTIIGKNITLTNIPITILEPRITISDITLIYDENFAGSIPISVSNMKISGDNYYTILDNITIITNREYVEGMYNLVIRPQGSDCNVTIKNSIINATLVSASNLKLVETRASNTQFINNNITINEKYSYGDNPSFTVFGERGVETVNNLVFENNNITMTGARDDGTLYAFKMNTNNTQITNNNITVTTTGTAIGVELTGNDNTVTDNYIVANDKKGDNAVTVTGENNVVQDNTPVGPKVVTITESNFEEWFGDDPTTWELIYNKIDSSTIFNISYVPETVTNIWISPGGVSDNFKDYTISFVGNNLTLTNVFVYIKLYHFVLSDFNLVYDDNYIYDDDIGNDVAMVLGDMGNDYSFLVDNVNINFSPEYSSENPILQVLYVNQPNSNITYQNSEININVPVTDDGIPLFEFCKKVKFINNTINIHETMESGDDLLLTAFYAGQSNPRTSTDENEFENNIISIELPDDSEAEVCAIQLLSSNNILNNNTITITSNANAKAIELTGNSNTITNNNITVTTTGTATGVELTGNDNTVTDNTIIANDLAGDAAVIATGENNVVRDNLPAPSVNTLNDANWTEYFNDDGTVKAFIVAGSELRFEGEFNNRNMIISKALNLTSADTQAVLNNCTFTINADNVNVTGIVMDNLDSSDIVISVVNSSNVRIEDNQLTIANNEAKQITHTIEVISGNNNIIRNNTINTTGPEEDIVYDLDTNAAKIMYTASIYAESSEAILIDSNKINTKANDNEATELGTIYGVYLFNYNSTMESTISNNNITSEATKYAYSIKTINTSSPITIEENNIESIGNHFASAIDMFSGAYITVTNNKINAVAENITYAVSSLGSIDMEVYMEAYMDTFEIDEAFVAGANSKYVNIISNDITTESDVSMPIQLYYSPFATVQDNNITTSANQAVGIGAMDSNNDDISGNNINLILTGDVTTIKGDSIPLSPSAGIKLMTDGTGPGGLNDIYDNNIVITIPEDINAPVINLTNTRENTINDNLLLSSNCYGDNAVIGDYLDDQTIEDNLPNGVITEETYDIYFDECILKAMFNNTDLTVSGNINEKVFIFDGVNATVTNDGTATLTNCQFSVGNDATVVLDGIKINNTDMDAILLESTGNIINNSEIIVTSAYPLHAVEIAEDGNIIANTIITATIASADVAYDKDYVGLPQSSALYISSNNNLLDNVTVSVDGTSVAEGSYYPSIDAIDFQSTGKGVVIENNTITNSKVIATGSNYVYGINVGRAKDTTIENVNIDVESDYYTNGIQLFDAVDIKIDGTIDSTAATQAYGVYATAMAVGTSSGIDLTGLNISVESPDATGVLIEGASDVVIADATYDISGDSATAVNAHVDWMGNIPENITVTGMDINIDTAGDANVLYFGLCDDITITDNNIETTGGSRINFNKTSNAKVTDNYIVIKDIATGYYGNYAVMTTEDDTIVENNEPTTPVVEELQDEINNLTQTVEDQQQTIDDLQQQLEQLQQQLDQLNAPKATQIVFDPIEAVYNSPVTITGELTDDKDNLLHNKNIVITFNGKTYTVKTKAGVFEFVTDPIKSMDEQTITAAFEGNEDYNATQATTTFTMNKQNTSISIDEIADVKYQDIVTITGTFKNANGQALTNSNVKVTVNGQTSTVKTDANGVFTLEYKASTMGENTVTVSYAGNAKYNGYETTTTFNTDKKDTILTIDEITDVKYQDTITITGTFKNADGSALRNSNVVLYINGEYHTVRTDNNGVFTYEYKAITMGENNITVTYAGNARYNAAEATTTFTVDKKDTVMTVDAIADVNKGDSVTVTGTFKNADGTAFRNSNVVVYVNGAHHTVKTDNSGNYNYTFTAKLVGDNEIRVVFNGNNKYNACETTTTFTVKE